MSTEIGRRAEEAAAKFLQKQGLKVIEQNWRTRWCEIDIVAEKAQEVYFIEVKYRSNTDFGSGFDYITPRKQRQVRFAAEFWLGQHRNQPKSCHIAAIELTGVPPQVIEWLPDI
ncbi:MAG TPA: YraN family protein [Candidatus Acidoferrum sp.]|nr:YraN family protein [Candidatus Acidoferrum sp.]